MLTVDTSGLIALLNKKEPSHKVVAKAVSEDQTTILVATTFAEIAFVLGRRLGPRAVDSFIGWAADGAFSIDRGDEDFDRIKALVRKYADLPLGFADAAVIACAERHGGRILTLDRRDFDVVARGEGTITLVP